MKKYLKKLPPEIKDLIVIIGKISQETRMPVYLVGGFLRDLILGVNNSDLDITVSGDGILFAEKLAKKLKSGIRIHERFKTATLILKNQLKVDIATTRKERYPYSASLPVVSLGSLREDLLRRDFTINAMAVSITPGQRQKLIDPFGGKDDLARGRICILHDLSFKDDPTRILRAIRFEQRFNFKIEGKTLKFLKQAINLGLLSKVNAQRIRDDLILMLKENNPAKQFKRLAGLADLSFISAKLKFDKTANELFKAINKEIIWFAENFPHLQQPEIWVVYFTALLQSLTLAEIKKIVRSLGLRKSEEKKILNYCKSSHKLISALSKPGISPAQVFSLLAPLGYEAVILLGASARDRHLKKYLTDFLQIYNGVRTFTSGKDLYGLGVSPGPVYREILAKVLAAKLNGKVTTFQDELVLIERLIKNGRLRMELN